MRIGRALLRARPFSSSSGPPPRPPPSAPASAAPRAPSVAVPPPSPRGGGGDGGGGSKGRFQSTGRASVAAATFSPAPARPLPVGGPDFLDAFEASKAPRNSAADLPLSANPYGWAEGLRLARQAPQWMMLEAEREEYVPPPAADDGSEKKRTGTLLELPPRDAQGRAYATGGRKAASAQVWVAAGDGAFSVNRLPLNAYFKRLFHRKTALEPLVVAQAVGAFDVVVSVRGGGLSGQAGAVKHGLAKALARFDPALKPLMRGSAWLISPPPSPPPHTPSLGSINPQTRPHPPPPPPSQIL
jgi:small subunit ribosomal protein S9